MMQYLFEQCFQMSSQTQMEMHNEVLVMPPQLYRALQPQVVKMKQNQQSHLKKISLTR